MRLIEPVTRRRREQVGFDAANRPLYEWRATRIAHCALAPNAAAGGAREPDEVGRNLVRSSVTAYFAVEVDVLPEDELVIRGRTWRVDGEAEVWVNPFAHRVGLKAGTVVHLTRTYEAGEATGG